MSTYRCLCPAVLSLLVAGCTNDVQESVEDHPRPVSVIRLTESNPSRSRWVTGAVGSWKTEDIGFEVSGRVEFVVEPKTDVEGYIDQTGAVGTELARLDTSHYRIRLAGTAARITTLESQKNAAVIDFEQVAPAEIEAAEAELELADSEFKRNERLLKEKAIAQAEFDQANANLKRAKAKVAQLKASLKAKEADVASVDAQIEEALQSQKDAERDVANCTLHAPFRGEVAAVHVIPGGTVQRGERVLTIQMMDPIKVEVEVSAEQARNLRYKDRITIVITKPDGSDQVEEGIVYQTDTTADPATRTFTITVLLRNQKGTSDIPESVRGRDLPITRDLWRPLQGLIDNTKRLFIEEESIAKDDDGEFLWKITERSGGDSEGRSPVLKVEKLRVKSGNARQSLLGIWMFKEVEIIDESEFDLDNDLVAGELVMPEGLTDWDGTVVFMREQWQLRPGDLVRIDLSGSESAPGLYVPLNSIRDEQGRRFVYVVDGEDRSGIIRKVQVQTSGNVGSLVRIEPLDDSSLAGSRIVTGRIHFLIEGESVVIADEAEIQP